MRNKKWTKFSKLTVKCYSHMIGAAKDGNCWMQAFELLKEIVLEERQAQPDFASQLEQLDDITDYEYDIQGWLEDCLDQMDMEEEYELLLHMCNDLLHLFSWPDYTGSDIKFQKYTALSSLGRKDEAAQFCKEWLGKEPENIVSAAACVYALMGIGELQAAEELVDQYIPDKTQCSDENDVMFTAASRLYDVMGKKKDKRQVDQAMETYDEYLRRYFEGLEDEEEDEDFWDEELPFD